MAEAIPEFVKLMFGYPFAEGLIIMLDPVTAKVRLS